MHPKANCCFCVRDVFAEARADDVRFTNPLLDKDSASGSMWPGTGERCLATRDVLRSESVAAAFDAASGRFDGLLQRFSSLFWVRRKSDLGRFENPPCRCFGCFAS